MKQVTIVVPTGNVNLSSITGSFEILTRANAYWERIGNKPMFEVRIASYEAELTLGVGFFSLHPAPIHTIKKTDLIIIPSLSYDYDNVLNDNAALIQWIKKQHT